MLEFWGVKEGVGVCEGDSEIVWWDCDLDKPHPLRMKTRRDMNFLGHPRSRLNVTYHEASRS